MDRRCRKNFNHKFDDKYPELALGDQGNAVILLQYLMQQLGIYQGQIDGIFSKEVYDAVRRLQERYRSPVTGTVDKDVWRLVLEIAVERGYLLTVPDPQWVNRFQTSYIPLLPNPPGIRRETESPAGIQKQSVSLKENPFSDFPGQSKTMQPSRVSEEQSLMDQQRVNLTWPFILGPHVAPYLTAPAIGKAFPRYFPINPYVPCFQHYIWQTIHPLGKYFVPQPPFYPHDCEWDR
ncbi:hypothetical protein DNHGIG_23510 [Collibacillus ludicampi]|jgi:peptidoglycan hydrolase-like protein with peptidoglycan-binding domain|uniref:Peptidoglycan binding-like domain-containing protein n=1 Tax=Collibacillus ludicampi TaxID=2771369 RepID=A0AAV4LG51_9BACL|nr:peptidoglycan-binding domain-containing protein [Collibacillus ludicampi]GIM46802.1 hypothetical protein DNHGIG_23510 [Collibacillus ludicampi]